ncbi:hypothetical protein AVEN_200620-1 [Araneus ventricosus]|uniref:Uncharacterized protein n=1 Tax=Araneus ventricosus TaxID=182803 RepID=A0A4Y2SXC9_ARAVE|nr:hypothetical protein AVEN_200620-1 [Araneus ventricosus]
MNQNRNSRLYCTIFWHTQIEQSVAAFFLESKTSTSVAFGCDGTSLNIRKYGDFLRLLVEKNSLANHYGGFISLLHVNEFERIGKDLEKCEKRPAARFHWNSTRLPEFSVTDKTYLVRVVSAVSTGIFPKGLINHQAQCLVPHD